MKESSLFRRCCVISFCIPFGGMVIVMAIYGCAPFGNGSFLYCDMYHQYYPFFLALRRCILQGQSLIYNWSLGLGTDQLSLIAYYLASPLNLIGFFLPETALPGFFSLLVPIKLGLAGVFFCLFLSRTFYRKDLSVCLFSAAYALCAWALGYQWNIMWLDSFAVLPLVVLGFQQLLQENKGVLYTVSLFFAVLANYYIGYFICIFVALLFLCHCICNFQLSRLLRQLGRLTLYSGLALGITAFLTLPAFAALRNTHGVTGSFPDWNILKFSDLVQVAGNTAGGAPPSFLKGLPNIACTTGALFFSLIHLWDKQVPILRRLCAGGLLLFFLCSFLLPPLDYIWHGFHFPNMIPFRYSFLFSFVVLWMGYQGFLAAKDAPLWHFPAAALCCALLFAGNALSVHFCIYNGIFLLAYCAISPQSKRAWGSGCIAACLTLELAASVWGFAIHYPGKGVNFDTYPREKEDTQALLSYTQKDSADFFRIETTYSQTLNDSALNGYSGISCFSSTVNVNLTRLMRAMGLAAWEGCNRYCYELGSPVGSLFLNLKYLLHREDRPIECAPLQQIARAGTASLWENTAHLPLGFLADIALADFDFYAYNNPFSMENQLLKAAAEITEDVWTILQDDAKDTIHQFKISEDGLFCATVGNCPDGVFSFYKNGKLLFQQRYSLPQTFLVSMVAPEDLIEIHVSGEKVSDTAMVGGILREDVFWQSYAALSASKLELESLPDTDFSGTIRCHKDGILYTSIPQDGNWIVEVDGVEITPTLIGEVMVGIPLSQGYHSIHFSYENKAFSLGCFITLGTLCFFVIICIYKRKKANL